MNAWLRLRQWWLLLRCGGSVDHLSQGSAVALNLLPAGGGDVGAADVRQLRMFQCSKGHDRCARCPRFQAYRESLAAHEDGRRNLHVTGAVDQREAHGRYGDREAAQVDHGHKDIVPTSVVQAEGWRDAQPHAVKVPVAPCVHDAKQCAQHRNGKCHTLDDDRVHTRPPFAPHYPRATEQHQRGHTSALAWLAACAIALVLAGANLLDGPTDHSTEAAQAQALDDAYAAEAARLTLQDRIQTSCGPNAAWRERADGDIQCLNKHGRKTIVIAGVQP